MRLSWKDTVGCLLALAGTAVTIAALRSYSWWWLGSWKGAVGVLAIIGLGILLTNVMVIVTLIDIPSFVETLLWLSAATAVIASLLAGTGDRAEFITVAVLIGLAWLSGLVHHLWISLSWPDRRRYHHAH